jgi:hypothetical protein
MAAKVVSLDMDLFIRQCFHVGFACMHIDRNSDIAARD